MELGKFWKEAVRVLRITRKPNKEEYLTTLKITSIGMALIGLVGFIIFLLKQVLF
jgi:protein transport protein SEC61 subunit gamma and related proteins